MSCDIERRGLLLVLSSPSGAGKTTLAQSLASSDASISMSVSVTTRAPRQTEINGKDYIFISQQQFETMRQNGELIESALIFGYHYGTPAQNVEKTISQGRDLLFDVDWQGRQQLAHAKDADVVSVFILPPNAQELSKRLIGRKQDNQKTLNQRMKLAPNEISHYAEYDYIIINDDLDDSLKQLQAILIAERRKRTRLSGISQFVSQLQTKLKNDNEIG